MGLPPELPGALNVIVALPLPGGTVPMVGAPDASSGVTLLDAAEDGPVPLALVAVTVKVYVVPLFNPVMTC